MKITYNEDKKSLIIDDGMKFQYFLLKMMLIFTFLSSLIFLYKLSENHFEMMGFIWITLGITSSILLIHLLLKRSAAEKIELNRVAYLEEKHGFGRKRLSLRLKNGKTRNLITRNQSEISEIKKLFDQIGISTTEK